MINSLQNKKIIEHSKLSQKKYRKINKQYIIEGINSIDECIKHDQCVQIYTTESDYSNPNVKFDIVSLDVMYKLYSQRPIVKYIAVSKIPEEFAFQSKKIILLNKISDPGNMGTIIRTARAFGFTDIFIDSESVDVYNDKVVRAMMGVQYGVNFMSGESLDFLTNTNLPIVTTYLDEESEEISTKEFVLVFGNETRGIDKEIKELPHFNYKLDIEFESLNVAVASGIIMNKMRME